MTRRTNRLAWGLAAILGAVVLGGSGVLLTPYIHAKYAGYKVDFHGRTLIHAPLAGSELDGANFCGTNLYRADLRHASLWRLKAVKANLRQADLTNALISDANLSAAQMEGAILSHSGLDASILRDAILTGANLHGAEVAAADLTGADLRGANLTNVVFGTQYAFLPGATLKRADLRGADLSGATALTLADLGGARYDDATRWPAGFDPQRAGAVKVE